MKRSLLRTPFSWQCRAALESRLSLRESCAAFAERKAPIRQLLIRRSSVTRQLSRECKDTRIESTIPVVFWISQESWRAVHRPARKPKAARQPVRHPATKITVSPQAFNYRLDKIVYLCILTKPTQERHAPPRLSQKHLKQKKRATMQTMKTMKQEIWAILPLPQRQFNPRYWQKRPSVAPLPTPANRADESTSLSLFAPPATCTKPRCSVVSHHRNKDCPGHRHKSHQYIHLE